MSYKSVLSCLQMDNLGFQHGVEEASFSVSENSNNEYIHHWPRSLHLLPCDNGYDDAIRESRAQQKENITNTNSPKLSSSSFTLPKNKTLNKYKRFSESFSCTSRVPSCVGKMLNIPSREGVKHDNINCSSFIVSDNNNVNKSVPDSTARWQQHSCEDGGCIEIHCNSSNPVSSDECQPNNLRIRSSQNFQGHNSVSPVLNNMQECSNHAPVPSLSLNNNYHEGYLSSMPSISKPPLSLSSSFSNKHNLISDTSLDIHNTVTQSLKSTSKYSNLGPVQTFNNAQSSESSSPSLMKKQHQLSKEDADLHSLPCIIKSQKNVNHILNRATTLPAAAIKNVRNQNTDFTSCIPTVSGAVPMYYSGFLNQQQASPNPCAENRLNMRRSSKVLSSGRGAKLKKRAVLRRWKLQFIPSDHSKRRTLALCCVLFLAGVLVMVATGLIIYITTGQ